MKQKKYLIPALSLLFVAAAVAAVVFFGRGRSADFPFESKTGLAMGTVVSVKIYDEEKPAMAQQTFDWINALEQEISLRVETSPVAQFNRTGACVNDVVADVVARCAPISDATQGAFDLTVGAVSALWDFGGEHERLPDAREIMDALKTVDYRRLERSGASLRASSGQQLDLGAVGKGLACDSVKQLLQFKGVKGGVVSVGGSICAFGSRNPRGDLWRVAIKHPRKADALLGTLRLKEGFVSTSGDYEKYFEQDGKRYFHILDARTGYPAQTDLCSVTVVCDNGMLSDALSTACFLLGEENSRALLEEYHASAVFVNTAGEISTFGDLDFTPYES